MEIVKLELVLDHPEPRWAFGCEKNIKYLRKPFSCGRNGVLISSIVLHFLPALDPLPVSDYLGLIFY